MFGCSLCVFVMGMRISDQRGGWGCVKGCSTAQTQNKGGGGGAHSERGGAGGTDNAREVGSRSHRRSRLCTERNGGRLLPWLSSYLLPRTILPTREKTRKLLPHPQFGRRAHTRTLSCTPAGGGTERQNESDPDAQPATLPVSFTKQSRSRLTQESANA